LQLVTSKSAITPIPNNIIFFISLPPFDYFNLPTIL